ncbi:kynurenine--oxoglutarate transaminase 3 [Aspergillus niger]|uniref:Kynurenine--oxoglutarate transaminase 3 n=1 Tax=Aspergillus niger TaxID=5061 RepID=A0A9W6ECA0_ASPNG|nr:kynurenine--oxoglutarate transaminase 3 [Aspergillus niger]
MGKPQSGLFVKLPLIDCCVVTVLLTMAGRFECNMYAPTKGRSRLREAISKTYTPLSGCRTNPETEVLVTTGANEGMLSVLMAFLNPGDELHAPLELVAPCRKYLDDYRMAEGVMQCVPLRTPAKTDIAICSSTEWTINFVEVEQSITSRTKMIVINTPHNPTGKVFSREGLRHISDICVRHNLLVLRDEVFQEWDFAYTIPEGGYFVLVNLAKVQIPREYRLPPYICERRRDILLAWFLTMELGVAAIPASEFYSPEHACLGEKYLRLAVCQGDDILDLAKARLRGNDAAWMYRLVVGVDARQASIACL